MKRQLRFTRERFYEKPSQPKEDSIKFREEVVITTGDRYHYFPDHYDYDDYTDEDEDENTRELKYLGSRRSLSLKKINELVKEQNLNEEDVIFTVSRADDYINLDVIYMHKMTYAERLEEYEERLKAWNKQEEDHLEQERQSLKRQMEILEEKQKKLKR